MLLACCIWRYNFMLVAVVGSWSCFQSIRRVNILLAMFLCVSIISLDLKSKSVPVVHILVVVFCIVHGYDFMDRSHIKFQRARKTVLHFILKLMYYFLLANIFWNFLWYSGLAEHVLSFHFSLLIYCAFCIKYCILKLYTR